ncbi:hypothetical protein [Mesorhizobium sp. J8]|uniref:hypothetical protein n=1 Tax=Mesorhizobium sp. J8 TaxID=2777475 RepID=UPI001916B0CA|nr:hypothetical protein [Mesorhizobium sp. J8]BCM17793.1 hypothetical protein MJ8_15590 [Mesorhizobium sp. J8]
MTHRNIVTMDGGSSEYWRQRKQGFRLIREAEWALSRLERAPMSTAAMTTTATSSPSKT